MNTTHKDLNTNIVDLFEEEMKSVKNRLLNAGIPSDQVNAVRAHYARCLIADYTVLASGDNFEGEITSKLASLKKELPQQVFDPMFENSFYAMSRQVAEEITPKLIKFLKSSPVRPLGLNNPPFSTGVVGRLTYARAPFDDGWSIEDCLNKNERMFNNEPLE